MAAATTFSMRVNRLPRYNLWQYTGVYPPLLYPSLLDLVDLDPGSKIWPTMGGRSTTGA
uniref:Uncharacterized protein n=1 Tax=Leersia perrieri TaxID=77586 RepID=A0A0D9XPY0_9ORYZ